VVGAAPGPDASDVLARQEVVDAPAHDIDPRDVATEPANDLASGDAADDVRADAPDAAMADAATTDAPDVVTEMDAAREDRPFVFPDLAPILVDLPMDLGPEAPAIDAPTRVDVPGGMLLPGPSRSGALAVTVDERIAVAANRTADSVSVFALAPGLGPNLLRLAELPTGLGSEPWAVTADTDGDAVFVLLRRARRVIRVTDLRSAPRIAAERGVTGSEPTALALSPTGRWLYVSNFADGTVTELDARTLAPSRTIDLNAALAATGVLGVGVTGRVGLAHPRALAVTNNGDDRDDNDALYVTEFFAQRRTTGVSTGLDRFDTDRQGVVYRVPLDTLTPAASFIAPATDTGFRDGNNVIAGCIPNQLHALAIAGARVYVTAVCASPRGPIGFPPPPTSLDGGVDAGADAGRDAAADVPDADVPPPALVPDPRAANLRTQQSAAIFVLDATNGAEIPARRLLLNSRFQALYDARRLPDDGVSRRMPLIPMDLAFQPGTFTAYVVGYGSDALFRVRFNSDGSFAEVGLVNTPGFVNLDDGVAPAGQNPIGVAVVGMNSAYVLNEHTRNVSGVSLLTQTVLNAATSSAPPTGDDARRLAGRRDFVTGTGRWSWQGQAWSSCEACHPDGLSDGVTWYFPRGPRQTPALDSVFDRGTAQQRLLGWTAHLDEPADFEALVRDHSGGVGAVVHRVANSATPPAVTESDRIVFDGTAAVSPQVPTTAPQDGLSGAITEIASREGVGTPRSVTDDWADLTRYLRAVRTLSAPAGLQPAQVAAGRALFLGHRCDGCHAGPLWTVSSRFYTPSAANNARGSGALMMRRFALPTGFPTALAPVAGTYRLSPFDAANDQIVCALRNVGTFATGRGVAATDLNPLEVRANAAGSSAAMTVVAQGANGFNVPSLLGLATSAPYLHGGAARTLEELLSDTFRAHRQAFSTGFNPTPTEVSQLVSFLLSLDGAAPIVPLSSGLGFDPDLCAGY
jgi:DNA-binding beta-propeller fold protein YncE